MCVALLVAVTAVSNADAQTYSYSRIETNGNVRIDSQSLIRISGLPESGTVSATQLNSAFRAISDRALFEEISLVPRGGVLEINVVEFPTINRIDFEGNRTIKDEQLTEVIFSKPRQVYVPAKIENDASRLAEAYFSAGRLSATVTPKIIRRTQNRVDVVFEVIEGRVTEIERISFIGNSAFSDSRLRRVLNTKQANLLRTFTTNDTFLPDRIELDKTLLRDFYLSRGFVDFRVLSATSEISRARDAFIVVFKIEEGQPYNIRKITASSELPEVDAEEYLAESRIKPGDRYSPVIVDDTIKRMEFLASSRGLQFVRARPEVDPVQTGTLDINFSIERGQPLLIERIEILGNETTLDRVVRRQFDVAEGDPYNDRSIAEAAERIRALGFFSSVDVADTPVSDRETVVTVQVEEQNTGSLGLGATYSKQSGVGYSLSVSERNLLGRGQTLGFSFSTGSSERTYTLYFIEPSLFDRDLEFGMNLSNQNISNYAGYADFKEFDIGAYLSFPIGERSRLTPSVSFTRQTSEKLGTTSGILEQEFNKSKSKRSFLSVGLGYQLDTISSGVYSDRGFLFEANQRLSFGKGVVAKTTASVTAQTVLSSAVLQARLGGGFVTATGSRSTHLFDRFHSDSTILRGFEAYGIGPRTTTSNPLPLGGNKYVSLQVESLYPLSRGTVDITGALFADAATIWGLDNTDDRNDEKKEEDAEKDAEIDKKYIIDDKSKIRAAAGLGLIVRTPIGPLRFNFTRPLKKYDGDKTQNFEVTFSSVF